jgi:signal peptidase II
MLQQNPFGRNRRLVHAIALAVVALDALGKWWALVVLTDAPLRLPGVVFELAPGSGSEAAGASWLGTNAGPVMAVFDALLLGLVVILASRIKSIVWAVAAGLGAGAATADLIDRLVRPPGVFRGHLLHWIDPAWSASFNIADVAFLGAAVLAASLARTGRAA